MSKLGSCGDVSSQDRPLCRLTAVDSSSAGGISLLGRPWGFRIYVGVLGNQPVAVFRLVGHVGLNIHVRFSMHFNCFHGKIIEPETIAKEFGSGRTRPRGQLSCDRGGKFEIRVNIRQHLAVHNCRRKSRCQVCSFKRESGKTHKGDTH
jgi:hypothetical protein